MEGEVLEIPEAGRDVWLKGQIEELEEQMRQLLEGARERGREPRVRAQEAERVYRDGDGF